MKYERKQYVDQLIHKKDNGRVKVITGLRRSGKSYLLFTLFREYLLKNGAGEDQIIGLALDEFDNAALAITVVRDLHLELDRLRGLVRSNEADHRI